MEFLWIDGRGRILVVPADVRRIPADEVQGLLDERLVWSSVDGVPGVTYEAIQFPWSSDSLALFIPEEGHGAGTFVTKPPVCPLDSWVASISVPRAERCLLFGLLGLCIR